MKKDYEKIYFEIAFVSTTDILNASGEDDSSNGYFDNELPLIPSDWI